MVNGSHDPDGLNVGAAAAVKQVVDVPVIAVGRIHDSAFAEQILADGRADFVAMGRPLLADEALVEKVRTGGRVRRCISCQNCIDALEIQFSVNCAVNARTGREQELTLDTAARAKRVVVVGGGPAGLEAARVAARRGHHVVLCEREDELGGALRFASVVHPENGPFLEYLRAEVADSGVEVRLGHAVAAEDVVALEPDAVVVATGGQVALPAIAGADQNHVRRAPAWAEMLGAAWGRRVAVVGGTLAGLQLAEFLAADGRLVSVLEPGEVIGAEVGLKRRTEVMDRLDRLGVPVNTGVEVVAIVADGVVIRPAGGSERRVAADRVVLVGAMQAAPDLFDALQGKVPEVHAIGDCTGLGLIRKATEDGARVAATI
jgi:2,4-dienoyl-CoA reductase (NADPH2)